LSDVASFSEGPRRTRRERAHRLAGRSRPARLSPRRVRASTGRAREWFEVDPALEATAFVEGVRRGGSLALAIGADAVRGRRRPLRQGKPIELSARSSAARDPGRTARSRAHSTWPGSPTPAHLAGAAIGWTNWPSGRDAAAGLPSSSASPHRVDHRRGLRRPLHRQAPLRRLVDRHRRSGRPGDGAARLSQRAPRRRCGARAVRSDYFDLQGVCARAELELSAIEPFAHAGGAGAAVSPRSSATPTVRGGEAWPAPPGAAGRPRREPGGPPARGGKAVRTSRRCAGHAHRLPLRRNELVVNEINTIPAPWRATCWIEPAVPSPSSSMTCSRGPAATTHRYSAAVPTASCCGAHRHRRQLA